MRISKGKMITDPYTYQPMTRFMVDIPLEYNDYDGFLKLTDEYFEILGKQFIQEIKKAKKPPEQLELCFG